jgi:hypothetical protein
LALGFAHSHIIGLIVQFNEFLFKITVFCLQPFGSVYIIFQSTSTK